MVSFRSLSARARGVSRTGFARDAGMTYGTRLAMAVIGLATTVIVARALGPDGRGAYALAIAIGAVSIQFGHVGLHAANTYFVAREPQQIGVLVGNSLAVGLAIGGGGAALLALVFVLAPGAAPVTGVLLGLALIRIGPNLGALLLRNILIGAGDIRGFNISELGPQIVAIAALGVLVALGADQPAVIFAPVLGAGVLGLLWSGERVRRRLTEKVTVSWTVFKRTAAYGVKVWGAALGGFLIVRSDLFVLGYMRGDADVGVYSVAAAIANALLLLPIAVSQVLFPRLSANRDDRDRAAATRKVLLVVGLAMLPLVGGAIALASPAIEIAFGDEFAAAAGPTRILALSVIPLALVTVLMQLQAARGLPWIVVWIWAAAVVLNIGLNIALIPSLGIEGAAWASLISYGAAAAAHGTAAWRRKAPPPEQPAG